MSDPLLNNNIWSSIILVVGSIITTFLTVKYKGRIQNRLLSRKPKDRLELIFDGYERLISDLQNDLVDARQTNNDQHKRLQKMQEKVDILEGEMEIAHQQNKLLISRLRKYEPEFQV